MVGSSRVFRDELFEVFPRCGDVDLDEGSGDLRLGIETAVAALAVAVATLLGGGHDHHDVCIASEQVNERRELRVPHLHALRSYSNA